MNVINALKGVMGPGISQDSVSVDVELPDCIQIKTEDDKQKVDQFVSSIIKAANQNAWSAADVRKYTAEIEKKTKEKVLEQLAEYVAQSNKVMLALVKDLKG